MRQLLYLLAIICLVAGCASQPEEKGVAAKQEGVRVEPSKELPAFADSIRAYLLAIDGAKENDNYDTLAIVNAALLRYLEYASVTYPALLNVDFPGVDTLGMAILTSDDRKFRIYCWDTRTGGTMRFFNSVAQYSTNTGAATMTFNDIASGDIGVWYPKLHTITTQTRGTIYLAHTRAIASSRDVADGISAYAIADDGRLNDSIVAFKTATKNLNDISYSYDYHSNIDDSTGAQRNTLRLSEDKRTLYVPIVGDNEQVTSRSLVYKFDGDYFVFDKHAR
ncbi:MAG: hypothetical protein JNL72_06755 [Flavipsychrobacter sp.]|nr:hypothetical protein [Flavipsychrobacter sp.]